MITILLRILVLSFLLLMSSCDYNRNNPLIEGDLQYTNIITNSAVRDFVIIENFTANNFHYNAINHSCTQGHDLDGDGIYEGSLGEQDCYGFWCEWDGDSCNDIDRDVIAVANDEAGLFIYEIINGVINPQEIYFRNLIEFAGDGELDIELRNIYYAENHNTLYMLDKFEYIYNLYLPPVISEYNDFPNEHDCILPSEQALEYLVCGQFDHATKFIVNEGNPLTMHELPFEMFVLYKENPNTNSSLTDSHSEIRRYWYNNNPNGDLNSSPVCDNALTIDSACDDGLAFIDEAGDCFYTIECTLPDECNEIEYIENEFFDCVSDCLIVEAVDGMEFCNSFSNIVNLDCFEDCNQSEVDVLVEIGTLCDECLQDSTCNDYVCESYLDEYLELIGIGCNDSDDEDLIKCSELSLDECNDANICEPRFCSELSLDECNDANNICEPHFCSELSLDVCMEATECEPSYINGVFEECIGGFGVCEPHFCSDLSLDACMEATGCEPSYINEVFEECIGGFVECYDSGWTYCADEICTETLIDNNCSESLLSYNVTDLYFDTDNNRLFIANPSDLYNSVNLYFYNPISGSVFLKDKMITNTKINTVISKNDYMIVGMKDAGCYITLLNEHGISGNLFDKLHIGEDFSVYDISYDEQNNKLVLACGSNGVLVYNWDGESLSVMLENHILSSYAHTAKYHDGMAIVGTENGIEIFYLGD